MEVRIVFLRIGEIDTQKEKYTADVFLQAKWREPKLDGHKQVSTAMSKGKDCLNKVILSVSQPNSQLVNDDGDDGGGGGGVDDDVDDDSNKTKTGGNSFWRISQLFGLIHG